MQRLTTIKLGACVGYRGNLAAHQLSIPTKSINMGTIYNDKSFFDNKNYRWIIVCLNDGYTIATNFMEWMQDYHDLLQENSHRLTSYSKKWKSKLINQSSLSSYNTTKRAQFQTIGSSVNLAQLIQMRCDEIQRVIVGYKNQVERMYPREYLGLKHKHYRASDMEKLFKNASLPLSEVSAELKELRTNEEKAREDLCDAKTQCQNLELAGITSEKKLTRANDHLEKKQGELQAIERRIARAEVRYTRERETYRENATAIYLQCRTLEEERLNQIRETLIQFTQAIHSSEYSVKLGIIYEDLLSNLNHQQNTLADLNFWAQTYHVNIQTMPSEPTPTNDEDENNESQTTTTQRRETTALTTTEENTLPPVTEAQEEEDQSEADKVITSAKTKRTKNKNNTSTPTTPNTAGLNQV